MLVLTLPVRVPDYWFVVRPGLESLASRLETLPEKLLAEVLKRCCAGAMQLWLIEDETGYCGFMLTEISVDDVTGMRALNIYALYLYKSVAKPVIDDAVSVLQRFAESNGCSHVTFTTDSTAVFSLANKWWPGWKVRLLARKRV